jgi:hypothetical protein
MCRALCLVPLAIVCACRTTAPPLEPAVATTTAAPVVAPRVEVSPAGDTGACDLVCGNAAALTVGSQAPAGEVHAADVANADQVFSAMRGDLLACYRARVAESPNAHAFLTVDVVVAPDGSVGAVETTGGALLGDRTMRCITKRIERAAFAPVRGGGTLHIQVPLSFVRAGADDSI